MKALTLTICGAAPLAICTLLSLYGLFVSQAGSSGKSDSVQAQDAELRSDERKTGRNLATVKAMTEWPGADGKLSIIHLPDKDNPLEKLIGPVEGLRNVKVFLDQLPTEGEPAAQKTRLEELKVKESARIQQLDKDGEVGENGKVMRVTSALSAAIDKLDKVVVEGAVNDQENKKATRALTLADADFTSGKYDLCLDKLKNLNDGKLPTDTLDKVKLLRNRASFLIKYKVVNEASATTDKVRLLKELVKEHKSSPSDAEDELYKHATTLLTNSVGKFKLEEWRKQTAADPAGQTPINVSVLVKEVAKPNASAENLAALEIELADWRARNLKEKDLSFFAQREEAKKKATFGGEVLIGKFTLNDDQKSFQLRRGDLNDRNFEDLAVAELEDKPHRGTHFEYAEKFNRQRTRILKEPASLDGWKQLERDCTEFADKIKEFDAKTNSVYQGKLKFDQDVPFIKEVIKELDNYPGLFGPFAAESR